MLDLVIEMENEKGSAVQETKVNFILERIKGKKQEKKNLDNDGTKIRRKNMGRKWRRGGRIHSDK